ncbi:MAG: hypothetical protein GXY85_01080 [Candidatus Brocadiaceae bacterium]|nr:hypothetical protein [Candidatus Brocadiaceae bacterium]
MNCERTRELLNAYLDGELSPERRAKVDEHLRACGACTDVRSQWLRLNRAIGSLPGAKVPDGFARRVRQAAEAGRALRVGRMGRRVRLFGDALTRIAAVFMAVAGVAVGMAMGWTSAAANGHATASDRMESEGIALQTDMPVAMPEDSLSDVYLAFVIDEE